MRTKTNILVGFILILHLGSVTADQPELGKYPKMYSAGNYKATILRIGENENSVLIRVDGIDNKFDGQIFLHKKICDNKRCTNYKYETTEIPGKTRWWTIQSTRTWGDYDSLILYPPGIDIKYDLRTDKRPDSFDAKSFYQEYLGQKALRK